MEPDASDGTGTAPPYGTCAGWHVVYSSPTNGITPLDPTVAGGDAFDLADHRRHARARTPASPGHRNADEICPDSGADEPTANGFDLDAVAIVNAEEP